MKFMVINDPLQIREWIKAKTQERREREAADASTDKVEKIQTAIIDPRRINQFIAK